MDPLRLEVCQLEFDNRQKVFVPPKTSKSIGLEKERGSHGNPHTDNRESGTRTECAMSCHSSKIIPFVGDPIHSKIDMSIRAPYQKRTILTCCVLDSGSEVNVIVDDFFRQKGLKWDKKLDHPGNSQFSGPSGAPLSYKGDLKLWVTIDNKCELLSFVILKGNSPTVILGNPGMKKFDMCVKPGKHATLNVRHCKELCHQEAASKESQLPPLTFLVEPPHKYQIPRFSQKWVTFHPSEGGPDQQTLDLYEYQQFLFRDCDCVLKGGPECSECEVRGEEPPFQLSRLEKGQFQVCFLNTKNVDWVLDTEAPYSVEFCPMYLSRSSIAKDLLVSFEHFTPEISLTKKEVSADFECQFERLKGQLAEIVCEPQGFSSEGFHGPTLQIFPTQPLPTFSQKSIHIKDYIKTNPCSSCQQESLSSCDPKKIGCITRQLYQRELPKDPLCGTVDHDKTFPVEMTSKRKCVQIWAVRPNYPELIKALRGRYPEYSDSCEQRGNVGGTLTKFVRLAAAPITLRSTEALEKVSDWCIEKEYFEVFFPNYELFCISNYRGKRIFSDSRFRLHFYKKNPVWQVTSYDYSEKGEEKLRDMSMSSPKPEQVLHGLPQPLSNPDLQEAEEKAVKEGKVEEVILCNSEKVRKETISLLDSHPALWAKSSYDVGLFKHRDTGQVVRFELKLKHIESVVQPPRFVSASKQAAAKEVLAGLLKMGVIKSQYSRNRLNAVYVPKKVQPITMEEWTSLGRKPEEWRPGMQHPDRPLQLRMTIDMSPLNKQLEDIPMIPSDPRHILTAVQDNRLLSVADISLAFNSLLLSRASQDLCGFSPGIRGVPPMIFGRVAMGAKSSSQLLQLSMNHALQGCLDWTFILADDIVILGNTEEQMLARLAKVFQCLENCGFVLKRQKLALYVGAKNPSIQIFGLNVDLVLKKCCPVAKKVDEILTRPLPSSITGVRSLNGMLAWQSGFLQGGPEHHAVLHAMTRAKEGQYDLSWTEERLIAVEFFLDKLSSPDCLLHLPDPKKTMYICSDASLKACGYYLYQLSEEGRPMIVAYQARVFSERQSKYSAFEREAISALFALVSFWNYVEGRKTVLITDSTTSFYINFFSKVNSKVARYRIFLQSLDWLEVCWKAGNSLPLKISDYLSRRSQCPKQKVNQQVTEKDCYLASMVASKLKREYTYSMDQSSHIIDYVMQFTPEELEKLPGESVYMDGDGVVKVDSRRELEHPHAYDLQRRRLGEERAQQGQGAPDGESDQSALQAQEEGSSKGAGGGGGKSGGQDSSPELHLPPSLPGDQEALLPNVQHLSVRAILSKEKEGNWRKEDVGNGLAEAMNEQCLGEEALTSVYSPSESYFRPPSEIPPPEGSTRIDKFLYVVQKQSPGVQFSDLRKAQKEDPHLEKIIKTCEQKSSKSFAFDKRTNYFLGGSKEILCREIKDPLTRGTRLQVCLPSHWAWDLAVMAHRSARLEGGQGRGQGPHFGPDKLAQLLSRRFYFRHMLKMLQIISRTCQTCVALKPGVRNRPNFFRRALLVSRPAQGWYIDAVKLSSIPNHWGFTSVLTIVCAYSHWLIVAPIKQTLDMQYTIELLYTYVFNYFNLPEFILVDNASVFCGSLVRDICIYLNVSLNSTARYQPRGNVSELLNRFLIAALSIQKENFTLSNKSWNLVLMHAITNINYSPYKRSKYDDSPARRFLGDSDLLKNAQIIGTCFDQIFEMFPSADERAKEARRVANALSNLKALHARQRREELSGNRCRAQFEVGDIVTCRYRTVPNKLGAHKLQKRFRFLFTVVYVQGSTAFLRPYSLGALERYLKFTDQAHRAPLPTPTLPTFKVSVTDLKRVQGGLQLYTNNSRSCHFSEFAMPEPPNPLKISLFTPINPWPDMLGDESPVDQYSDYQTNGDEDTLDNFQVAEEHKIRESGQQTFVMDESGRWTDTETGSYNEEPWLVGEEGDLVGADPRPGEVHLQLAGHQGPQPAGSADVGPPPNMNEGVAGEDVRLNKSSPQRLRRSCRQRKIPSKLQQVCIGPPGRTPGAQNIPRNVCQEEWCQWLEAVKIFFKPPLSKADSCSTVRTINFYDELVEKLDSEQSVCGDAQKSTVKQTCKCMECTYGNQISPCVTKRCHLCRQ